MFKASNPNFLYIKTKQISIFPYLKLFSYIFTKNESINSLFFQGKHHFGGLQYSSLTSMAILD